MRGRALYFLFTLALLHGPPAFAEEVCEGDPSSDACLAKAIEGAGFVVGGALMAGGGKVVKTQQELREYRLAPKEFYDLEKSRERLAELKRKRTATEMEIATAKREINEAKIKLRRVAGPNWFRFLGPAYIAGGAAVAGFGAYTIAEARSGSVITSRDFKSKGRSPAIVGPIIYADDEELTGGSAQ